MHGEERASCKNVLGEQLRSLLTVGGRAWVREVIKFDIKLDVK